MSGSRQKQAKLVFAPSKRPDTKYAKKAIPLPSRSSSKGARQVVEIGLDDSSDSEGEMEWEEQGQIEYGVAADTTTTTPRKNSTYRNKYGGTTPSTPADESQSDCDDAQSDQEEGETGKKAAGGASPFKVKEEPDIDSPPGSQPADLLGMLGDIRRGDEETAAIDDDKKSSNKNKYESKKPQGETGKWWRKSLPGLGGDSGTNTRRYSSSSQYNSKSREDIRREKSVIQENHN